MEDPVSSAVRSPTPPEVPPQPPQQQREAPTADQQAASFSESWMYWKKRQGSAEGQNRKMSSIDPFTPDPQPQPPSTASTARSVQRVLLEPNRANGALTEPSSASTSASTQPWTSYLNPLTYVPQGMFHLQLPPHLTANGHSASDAQSDHSSTTQTTSGDGGWFSWMWGDRHHDEDDDAHGALSTAETRRLVKECKKLTQNQDTVWAWYNRPLVPGLEAHGEVSVLGTKAETRPVKVKRYPNKSILNATQPKDTPAIVEPPLIECFREITTRTKVRLTTQLYYNFSKEKHLYLKRNKHTPYIHNVLVVSIVAQMGKVKHNMTASQLSDYSTESIKHWFQDNNPLQEYNVETISLEAAKLDASSLEHLFNLLTNWREAFKQADFLMIVGFKNTVPLSVLLMDILISRKIVTHTSKFGLLALDGIIPGPYSDELDSSLISYLAREDFEKSLSSLMHHHNVKLTVLGSLNNAPASLALHLEHSNIFRTMFFPRVSYDNRFEVELYKLLLMAQNLGHPASRLLIQVSHYFNGTGMFCEEISGDMFTQAMYHTLSTTRLLKARPLEVVVIEDPILDNKYNLIWTLHAFVDDFKSIKNIESLKRIKSWIESYKDWEPETKQLKELKYMLEVLRVEDYSRAILRD